MKLFQRGFVAVVVLIIATGGALAYVSAREGRSDTSTVAAVKQGAVSMSVHLVQGNVLKGSDGRASVALTLAADEILRPDQPPSQPSDLVVVLDRSGSMSGRKIHDARRAVLHLIERLTDNDRLAVVAYSNAVSTVWPLTPMTRTHRSRAAAAVQRISTGGGTNLGGGLSTGISTLIQNPAPERRRKLILISDGLANHGVTDPAALGIMASGGAEHRFSVSTVGVGLDFNEIVMTTIADHGAGRYYFLEDPRTFVRVFDKELQATRTVAATGLEIRIPRTGGVHLVDAGGYPITTRGDVAVVRPGDLLSGRQRTLYLTFQVPTDKERSFNLGAFQVRFRDNGVSRELTHDTELSLACLSDEKAVMAGIDKAGWGEQVVREDYSRLKESVAEAIRQGRKQQALSTIREYEKQNRKVNAVVGSARVAKNLDQDVNRLRRSVEETFSGAPAAVAEKKKQRSKALQYESYQIRRDKK
jgi:Ca-activated chloride channel family protein